MKDRRLYPRAPLETAVECQLAQAKGSLKALSRDIGAGGLAIVTSAKLSVGAALSSVRFTLPAEDKIPDATLELGAQVVRCTEVAESAVQFMAGLQFLEATRADLERIEEYVFRRLSPEAQAASRAEAKAVEETISVDVPEDLEELVDLVDLQSVDLDTIELETESDAQSGDAGIPAPGPTDPANAPPSPEPVEETEDTPARRIPFSQPISIRFDLFKDFVKEVAANISTSGMFIQAAKPRRIGSILEFSFDMGDDFTLLQGSGEVVWARHRREGPELPAGMGIRFIEMDPSSRNVIKRIVNDYAAQGHQPFDLEASTPTELPLAEAGLEEELGTESESEFVELEEVNPELRERLRTLLRAKRERDELLQRLKKSEREKYSLEKELAGIGAGAQKAQLGWKARLAELEETVLDAESVETDLKSNIEELASSLAAALEERDRLSTERDELIAKQEELAGQLEAHHTADEEIDALTEETEKLRSETAKRQKELEDEVAATRSEATESRSKAEALEAETDQLRSQLEDGQAKLQAAESQLEEARGRTDELEAQGQKIAELEEALTENSNELDVARQEIDRLGQERQRLESKVAEDATLIAAARDSADTLSSARNDFEAQLTVAAETEHELTARIAELEAEAESARKEGQLNLEQSGVQRAELKSKLERALEDMDRLLDSSERAKQDFEVELTEKTAAAQEAQEKQSELQASIDSLGLNLETAHNEIESIRRTTEEDLERERQRSKEAETRLSEVEEELAQAAQSKAELESDLKDLEKTLQARIDEATEEADRQGALVSELEAKSESDLEDLEKTLQARIDEATEEADRQGALASELEAKLETSAENEREIAGHLLDLETDLEAKVSSSAEIERELEAALAGLEETRTKSGEELAELRQENKEKEREFQETLAEAVESEAQLKGQLDDLRNEIEEKTDSASKEQHDLRRRIEVLETELDDEREAAETSRREIAAAAQLDAAATSSPAPLPYPSSPARPGRRRSRLASMGSGLAAGLLLGAIAVFALYRFSDFDLPRLDGGRESVGATIAERAVEDSPPAVPESGAATESGTTAEVEDPTRSTDLSPPTGSTAQGSSEPETTGTDLLVATSTSSPASVARQPDPATADEAVRAWAASWSDQRVEDYLSHYAADFAPADGSTRADWVEQRRVRVARPKSLEVTVRGLERDVLAPDRLRITFNQTYQSDTFGDEVNKTLEMVWEEDEWKIVREVSEPS